MKAVPPDSVAVPSVVEPSLKVTLPVGVPPPLALTVAVSVIGWTRPIVDADVVSDVVVGDPFTVSVVDAPADAPKVSVTVSSTPNVPTPSAVTCAAVSVGVAPLSEMVLFTSQAYATT